MRRLDAPSHPAPAGRLDSAGSAIADPGGVIVPATETLFGPNVIVTYVT
jgi:hypothetical protein